MENIKYFIDMDGTTCRFHDSNHDYIEAMWEQGFYRQLKPFEKMVEALRQMSGDTMELHILSSYLDTDPPFVTEEKYEWLEEYMSFIPKENIHFVECGKSKAECLKELGYEINPRCVLIDDYNANLEDWQHNGGTSIKFVNDINDRGLGAYGGEVGHKWTGEKIYFDNQPEIIKEKIEEYMYFVEKIYDINSSSNLDLAGLTYIVGLYGANKVALELNSNVIEKIEKMSSQDRANIVNILNYKISSFKDGMEIDSYINNNSIDYTGLHKLCEYYGGKAVFNYMSAEQKEKFSEFADTIRDVANESSQVALLADFLKKSKEIGAVEQFVQEQPSINKYQLTDETLDFQGHTLHRVVALKNFADVMAGDIGGWIESEDNLMQFGTSWVYDNAKVFEQALIADDAIVADNAIVKGDVGIFGNATVRGEAIVNHNASVYDNAQIQDKALVSDAAIISGNAIINKNAHVVDNAIVSGNARVTDYAGVSGSAKVTDEITVAGKKHLATGSYKGDEELTDNSMPNNSLKASFYEQSR